MANKRPATEPGVYSDLEEAFFAASDQTGGVERREDFADLDAGYQPVGFWQRLFGRRKR